MESPKKVSVVVAEELTLLREGIAALCEQSPKYSVVGVCGDGESAFRLISSKRPDVALGPLFTEVSLQGHVIISPDESKKVLFAQGLLQP